jgi:hypothetical protein
VSSQKTFRALEVSVKDVTFLLEFGDMLEVLQPSQSQIVNPYTRIV